MKNTLLMSLILVHSFFSSVIACDIHGKSGFLPENNLKISKYDKETNGMTKEKFEAIVRRVESVYAPIVSQKGATLQMITDWDDPTVNAYADRNGDGKIWHVTMYGGLARHPDITEDGLMLIVCHETGHQVGGAPKYDYGQNDWAAVEGQADYFATLKCLRRVLEKDDNVTIISKMHVDQEAVTKCKGVYKTESEIALCQRIAMAGKSAGLMLAGDVKISFSTPDRDKVSRTDSDHPWPQCRLDTFFQGTLCDKSFNEDVSETSPIPGTCIKRDGYTLGVRPRCWYKPGQDE